MGPRVLTFFVAGAAVLSSAIPAAAQTVPVSVASDGTPANNNSLLPSMSASGRFVTFMSFADNLVAGDTNGVEDVFLRDRDTDADGVFDEPGAVATVRVSQRGTIQANGPSHDSVITPDGRYVVFTSFASNLFAAVQPPLAVSVVLRWDRLSGDIVLVSQLTSGAPLLGARSVQPDVSDDGNSIVFVYGGSLATEADQGLQGVVYRRDVAAGTLTVVSVAPLVNAPGLVAFNESPSITADGRTIAYAVVQKVRQNTSSGAVYAARSGVVHLVDAATGGVRQSHAGGKPRVSRDGACSACSSASTSPAASA
jgi:Tol biopolymer transport system component